MRKIMMLTRNFPPMMTEGSVRSYRFAMALQESGWEPLVIGPELPAGTGVIPRFDFTVRYAGNGVEGDGEGLEGVDLFRALRREPVSGLDRLSRKLQAEQGGRSWEKQARQIATECMEEHGDIAALYAQAPPYDTVRLALELSRRYGLPLLPDQLWPCGGGSCRKDEELLIKAHHGLVVPTRYAKETLLKKYHGKVGHGDISVVPGLSGCSGVATGKRDHTGLRLLFLVAGGQPRGFTKVFSLLLGALGSVLKDGERMMFAGPRSHEAAGVAVKAGNADAVDFPGGGTMEDELNACARADLCCMVLADPLPSAGYFPERLVDVLSCCMPVIAALPRGYDAKGPLDAGVLRVGNDDPGSFRDAVEQQLKIARGQRLVIPGRETEGADCCKQDASLLLRELMARLPPA
ncbi:glycosyltransferase family 4 protein [Prosthecochloris vibrioformis]|uniref:Glycosyltransferase family 4 protein n=1 Tax=Prosthecochloris vibrioformis TaxID=1098 RepID=A0A5C4S3T9_PROVB|nr:glycosyltransferase family 4 protein [Prosthecochloris vibrioformis]TNJ37777.1 glycosyltransferase family 4 protein [Prosthecochloris vibrioformis]